MSPVGGTIGRYHITGKLGEGGMGVVYRAQDEMLKREVAIKVLRPEAADRPERVRRFLQEARAASALNHPNIITVHDAGEFEGGPFLVMELVEGESLRAQLRLGPVLLPKLLEMGTQAATALTRAHESGITHRDLKPENILLRPDGYIKILDFGLAKLKEPDAPAEGASSAPTADAALTGEGAILGTAAYMSPEQAVGSPVDSRSDIFSLALVLFECWQGSHPFWRKNLLETLHAVVHDRLPPLSYPAGGTEWGLARILEKALEKEPDRRYQTMKDLGIDLQRLRRDTERPLDPGLVTAGATPRATTGVAGRWKVLAAVGAAVLASLAAGYFYLHRRPPLTDKDTIVLADFRNTTGDAVFDETLRQGLAVQLGQSPFLSLVSDQRIQATLRLMGRPPDARLTAELAREVCERAGSTAVLEGSIATLGNQYVLGLRAQNCRTGDVLDEEQAQAAKKEEVLNALSQIASKFRTRAGESLASVEKHSTPLPEATTSSLEALKAYATAQRVSFTRGSRALPQYQRAVALDPQFALAHASLGLQYNTAGETERAEQSATKAYELRDRASDRERFSISLLYDRNVTGNLERGFQTCELWQQTYPRDAVAWSLCAGFTTHGTGRFEKAIEWARKSLDLDPDIVFGYANQAMSNFYLDRWPEATRAMEQAAARKLESVLFPVWRYLMAFLSGDKTGMDRQTALVKGEPLKEEALSHVEAMALAQSGSLRQARSASRHAVEMARRAGRRETAAAYEAGVAVWEAFYGNATEARRIARSVLEASKGREVQYAAALALGIAGDIAASEALAKDLDKRFPEDTCVQYQYLPVLRAIFALSRREPEAAVEALQKARPYELAVARINFTYFFGGLHSAYLRGEAYLALGKRDEAVAEFQKVLDHRGIVGPDPVGALARLQLGRAFALSGDKTKAKTACQDFLTLWKDADPDIPVLKQARAEYVKLQ